MKIIMKVLHNDKFTDFMRMKDTTSMNEISIIKNVAR